MKLFLRVLLLVVLFTAVGAGVMLYPRVEPLAKGYYHFYKGEYEFRNGNTVAAQREYQKALSQYPNPAEVYIKLGNAESQMKQPEKAEAYYQKALELSPGLAEAETQLATFSSNRSAQSELAESDEELAEVSEEEAVEAEPTVEKPAPKAKPQAQPWESWLSGFNMDWKNPFIKDDQARYRQGERLYAQGQYEAALDLYCDLTDKYPESPETLYSLAVTLAKNNAHQEAFMVMTEAVEQVEARRPELTAQWATVALRFKKHDELFPEEPTEAVSRCMALLAERKKEQEATEN